MNQLTLTALAIIGLTLGGGIFASVNSLKDGSLQDKDVSHEKQRQEESIEDMRTVVGGSLGGAQAGYEQREEERPRSSKSNQKPTSALSCEEALRRCQP